jgi:hypothetical protein
MPKFNSRLGGRILLVDNTFADSRAPKRYGLLSCLAGMLCVAVSFFWLPLYTRPAAVGGGTITGWEFALEVVNNMLAQGTTPGFILPISLAFLPLIAALLLGMLAVARVVSPRPVLVRLFLVFYLLGVAQFLVFAYGAMFGLALRLGYFGGILGYMLLLAGDVALRRAAARR